MVRLEVWLCRSEYGGLKSDQVKRLKDLETENARLRKATSDLTLDTLILQEAARGNTEPCASPRNCLRGCSANATGTDADVDQNAATSTSPRPGQHRCKK